MREITREYFNKIWNGCCEYEWINGRITCKMCGRNTNSCSPFTFIDKQFNLDKITHYVGDKLLSIGDFPHNIQDIYYVNKGKIHNYQFWILICSLSDGTYLLFEAICDENGLLGSAGNIKITLADTFLNLKLHAMSGEIYKSFDIFQKTGMLFFVK